MKITRLRTALVQIPFDPPIGLGGPAVLRASGLVLVFVESDQGVIGEGLVFTFNGHRLGVLDQMVRSFEPLLVGIDPRHSGAFVTHAWNDLRTHGSGGIAAQCLAGVECALWDLRGKLLGVNISSMLGACRTLIPAYQSSELWASLSLDALQRSAADQMSAGYRAMKMRLIGNIPKDIARVRAVREAIGPDVPLMADANQKLTVPQALRLGRMLEEFNLTWFEEPVAAHNHAGEAEVAAALDTPIASGESVYTSRGAMEMLQQHACDVLMPDLLRMGGPSEFMKAAAFAEAFNIPVSNHTYPEMSIGLLAAIPNVNFLECMPWVSAVYQQKIEIDGHGRALVPDRPGWGFDFDPAVIKRYSVA
ncbi:MAG: mandelate racemase/muconate lactonizing enzyme family protein [Rhizobiales bacterium]|nr:mandelate racemase/muconate lactonizing enzyme family protein [Hyphomicrobiales bacterium]